MSPRPAMSSASASPFKTAQPSVSSSDGNTAGAATSAPLSSPSGPQRSFASSASRATSLAIIVRRFAESGPLMQASRHATRADRAGRCRVGAECVGAARICLLLPSRRHKLALYRSSDASSVALVRLIDLIILQSAWHYSGRTVDGPFLGGLLTAISRPPMYSFVYSHFLVGARALSEVFVTDVFAALVAGGVVAYISPRRTAFRRPPMSFLRRLDGSAILAIGLSIAVGTVRSSSGAPFGR